MIIKRLLENIKQRQHPFAPQVQPQITTPAPGTLVFQCNICGQMSEVHMTDLQRETRSCLACGATLRWRAIIHLLSHTLFGRSLPLPDFPVRPDITGLGMSDWEGYALPLTRKLSYQNTFYHQPPHLDITMLDSARVGTCDFVIATDVFEHIAPPIALAFHNVWRLLKPGGSFILTVPYLKTGMTAEHFPRLHEYTIEQTSSGYILRNRTREGTLETFEDLVFHDGPGATLEMRSFSEQSLLEELRKAGFGAIQVHQEPHFVHGIYWRQDHSRPITARREDVPVTHDGE
jgi:SAM-dependent methyltransferase